ncbi:alginate lyase family protein [Symbiopectobacterium sp. RP]|uniref:alginate lyase family protein n=1 Tax=Symbiopectobacterium sp. RP TaxID=3248553 RepID=UPI003D2B13C7
MDALIMLRDYQGWKKEDDAQMREWMTAYLGWLQSSKLAKRESEAKNNHGSWYAAQVAGIAWYLDKKDVVSAMAALQRTKLNHQIQDDGAQQEELSRPRSFHYSYFNLQAITNMAILADKVWPSDIILITISCIFLPHISVLGVIIFKSVGYR